MSGPLVTIGVPTRNRASVLERALRSALAQEDIEVRVVVSDNASTDETEDLCAALLRVDPRLRYIRQPRDIGAEANFRAVLDVSTTPFFMWLADDDWIDAQYVARCVHVLQAHPDHVVVCGRSAYYRGGAYVFTERPVNLLSASGQARLLGFFRTVTLNGPFYGVIRRAALPANPVRRAVGADWLLVAALAYAGKIQTVGDVAINRSAQGASQDANSLRRAYGLTERQARHWYAIVALEAFNEIRDGDAYRGIAPGRRVILGLAAAALVITRFGPKLLAARGLARLGLFDLLRTTVERGRR
jgi:glycosyltransferase involved in cell wall biosynthesis